MRSTPRENSYLRLLAGEIPGQRLLNISEQEAGAERVCQLAEDGHQAILKLR